MVKSGKSFWTLNRTLVTILLFVVFVFILFKIGVFSPIIDNFFTTSVQSGSPAMYSGSPGMGGPRG